MTSQSDVFTYHSPDALRALSLAEVEALWDLVPTERQRLYRAAYERTRRDEGASGSDALEELMLTQLLARYAEKGLVPVGAYWVPTPSQLQDAAKSDTDWQPASEVGGPASKRSPLILGAGGLCVLLFIFLILHRMGGSASSQSITKTVTLTPTATLIYTYTPTPLALDAQDAIIQAGTGGNSTTLVYPVNLRVSLPGTTQPRLFVVQRRAVSTTEWQYDDNPDVASYLVGLVVHPVLGIPWSDANVALFQNAVPGTIFTLQMNTGAVQRYMCTGQYTVGRSDTQYFAQDKPGLTLVLLGENPDTTELPTGKRVLLLADYMPLPDESYAKSLPTVPAPTATLSPTPVQRVDVQVVSISTQSGYLTVHLRLFNGQDTPLTLDSQSVWLIYGYAAQPVGPHVAADLDLVAVLPAQAADVTLTFDWHGEPFAMLSVLGEYQYALTVS